MSDPESTDRSTIFALSSGRGKAGVAVIRVSGPVAGLVLDRMAVPRPKARRAAFRRIVDPSTRELLDAALVLFFEGPNSETGEDIAELQLHGSPVVVRAVLQALGTVPGCRLAEPGEFARRAFLNGKIDLTAAEGIADLLDAETEAQRRQALAQAGGAFARQCDSWRNKLLEARALAEAAIDFSDEADVAADALQRARDEARALARSIGQHIAGGQVAEIIRDGFRVVITGPPNVGKSSLINALAKRDVAIVSSEPGTTRDVLEVHLDLAGYAVVVADTAGLREAPALVEQEGVRRAIDRARGADLVLWLVDATSPVWAPPERLAAEGDRLLTVVNKIDQVSDDLVPSEVGHDSGHVRISALTGEGISGLIARLSAIVANRLDGAADGLLPTQARHRAALETAVEALTRLCENASLAPELVAEELRAAADALGRITGRIDAEELLGEIFSRFCIGK